MKHWSCATCGKAHPAHESIAVNLRRTDTTRYTEDVAERNPKWMQFCSTDCLQAMRVNAALVCRPDLLQADVRYYRRRTGSSRRGAFGYHRPKLVLNAIATHVELHARRNRDR